MATPLPLTPDSSSEMITFDARLSLQYKHRVVFTSDALAPSNPVLHDSLNHNDNPSQDTPASRRLLACIDQGVLDHWPSIPQQLSDYAKTHDDIDMIDTPVIVVGGEDAKNDHGVYQSIARRISDAQLCRHSYVLAIGGGAVLDAVGFAASIAHRGVRLVRMPTTTLGQADSGIGVKNAVNAFGQKNFLGTFAPPWAVINDLSFLNTLTTRDWRAGLSEAVKVALIKGPALFEQITEATPLLACRDEQAIRPIIQRSAQLHLQHIAEGGDPFELTTARPLDFGHWSAHRLESMTDYQVGHGDAVAIGIALDCTYASLAGLLDAAKAQLVICSLQGLGFDTFHPAMRHIPELVRGLDEFRMHLGGMLTITLLKDIGHPVEVSHMDTHVIEQAVQQLSLAQAP